MVCAQRAWAHRRGRARDGDFGEGVGMGVRIETIEVTPLGQNCRILVDDERQCAVIVDPGGDANEIISRLESLQLTLEAIWLTHSHLDHCGGVADLLDYKSVPLYGHRIEHEYRSRVESIAEMYQLPPGAMRNCPEPDHFLEGGEKLSFGGVEFEVRYTPGHSPGHLVFVCEALGVIVAGDTLFAGSIGRTDLPGGNHEQLLESIRQEIYSLPDATRVLPGHGPDTSVGNEKRANPFVRGV